MQPTQNPAGVQLDNIDKTDSANSVQHALSDLNNDNNQQNTQDNPTQNNNLPEPVVYTDQMHAADLIMIKNFTLSSALDSCDHLKLVATNYYNYCLGELAVATGQPSLCDRLITHNSLR